MMPRTRVDRASTKPGQKFNSLLRRARARGISLPYEILLRTAPGYAFPSPLLVETFAHEDFQQFSDFAMLLGLGVDPVADHLLLRAHVVDQPLDSLGKIGHGGSRRPARTIFDNRLPEPLE